MTVHSAGLLVHRRGPGGAEFLLVHPGGPYWRGRDLAAWSIPKGLPEPGEALLAAALREFREETGLEPPDPGEALPPLRTGSGKTIHCWLAAGDLDLAGLRSGCFDLEWPPRSGAWSRPRRSTTPATSGPPTPLSASILARDP